MSNNPILSGSAMAVLCGVGCLIMVIFGGNSIDLLGKIIFFLFGLGLIGAGLVFSRG
jgi:hypothetical protein